MKRLIFISLFVFWAIIIAVLAVGLISRDKNMNNQISSHNQGVSATSTGEISVGLTTQEVAKHGSKSSCWMTINDKVYDVTSYIDRHPGGISPIVVYCGKDATNAFNVVVPHSQRANDLLNSFYLGDLNQNVKINPANPITAPTFQISSKSKLDDDD